MLNGGLDPADVTIGSGRLVWWRCARDESHVWQARVYMRAQRETGCPVCAHAHHRPYQRWGAVAEVRPDLVAEWHPRLNAGLSPEAVTAGSKRRVWWRCSVDPRHEWEGEVNVRAVKGSGCPFCAGRRTTRETCLRATHPAVAAEWDVERNGELTPDDVTAGANRRVWWRCTADPRHRWQVEVGVRVAKGTGCPFCAGVRKMSAAHDSEHRTA